MPENDQKLSGLRTLPIFPLPLVILPAEVLPLHIFEPRYRRMLEDITASDSLFGLNRFDPSGGPADRPEIGSVGCAAEVREVRTLPDGRSNIVTFGRKRYVINEYREADRGYLVAGIEFFDDWPDPDPRVRIVADKVLRVFRRVAKAANDVSGGAAPLPEIESRDPESLSFAVAAAFNLDVEAKSELLAMRETLDRLERLLMILESAVDKIEDAANILSVSRTNGHSKKKIDI